MGSTKMRFTSIEAYKSILPELGKKQGMVFYAIFKIQPCMDIQIANYLNVPINTITPRRGELVKKGLVEEHDIIKNAYGRKAIRWRIKRKEQLDLFS